MVIQFNGHPKGIVYGIYEGGFFCEASYHMHTWYYEYVPGISYIYYHTISSIFGNWKSLFEQLFMRK